MTERNDPLAARRAAQALILRALEDGAMLEEASLPSALPPAERARAMALARSAMRWLGPADDVLRRFVKRPPDAPVRALLRLATVEMLARGEAPHGVVDATVEIAKSARGTAKAAGLINAVLRRVAESGPSIWAELDFARLATPDWLWRQLRADWGKDAARTIAETHLSAPPTDLTAKADAAEWAAKLVGRLTPSGSIRLDRPGRLTGAPGYDEGAWWAQDAAAAIPARLAGPGEGRRALDLCAAPGGKTMQLAAAGWRVTALDASEARMARVAENLGRTGLAAETVVADALDWRPEAPFDLVLLDAPCTATGTIRRHPELQHIRDGSGLDAAVTLQARLLGAAWEMVAPGGRLIYATCSLNRAEGETQVAGFLETAPAAERIPVTAAETGDPALLARADDYRARPDIWARTGGMDGFFAARLARRP